MVMSFIVLLIETLTCVWINNDRREDSDNTKNRMPKVRFYIEVDNSKGRPRETILANIREKIQYCC